MSCRKHSARDKPDIAPRLVKKGKVMIFLARALVRGDGRPDSEVNGAEATELRRGRGCGGDGAAKATGLRRRRGLKAEGREDDPGEDAGSDGPEIGTSRGTMMAEPPSAREMRRRS